MLSQSALNRVFARRLAPVGRMRLVAPRRPVALTSDAILTRPYSHSDFPALLAPDAVVGVTLAIQASGRRDRDPPTAHARDQASLTEA